MRIKIIPFTKTQTEILSYIKTYTEFTCWKLYNADKRNKIYINGEIDHVPGLEDSTY